MKSFSSFKFHFDSINIIGETTLPYFLYTLNSTLILLIYDNAEVFSANHVPLNSTLILLIYISEVSFVDVRTSFKFHFDSINMYEIKVESEVNLNFKFHFDSINIK